ncbi:MAG: trypsin-like serine protease [Myxococcales bacterium]|nr:MAG: trypsin-like serine protease [Myxococcales bacterium]
MFCALKKGMNPLCHRFTIIAITGCMVACSVALDGEPIDTDTSKIRWGDSSSLHRACYLHSYPGGGELDACSCVVISPTQILTAGHCLNEGDPIRVGFYNERDLISVVFQKEFHRLKNVVYGDGLAVATLDEEFHRDFQSEVISELKQLWEDNPMVLAAAPPGDDGLHPENEMLWAVGRMNGDGTNVPDDLAEFGFGDFGRYQTQTFVDEITSYILKNNSIDVTDKGDSGGPLVQFAMHPDMPTTLYGILTRGNGDCTGESFPKEPCGWNEWIRVDQQSDGGLWLQENGFFQ